jgi:hypothetical protein
VRSATRKRTGRDREYLAWIRSLPCVCCWQHVFWEIVRDGFAPGLYQNPPTEAAHVGERGLSQKCPDREAIPLCKWHHTEGPESHHRLQRRFWEKWGLDRDTLVKELNARYEKEVGSPRP